MRRISLAPLLIGSLVLLADAAWAGGNRAVIVVRPSTVIVTPPMLNTQIQQPPIIQHPRFVRPIVGLKPAALEPLPQPAWVPGSWQWVENRQVWVPSHWDTPGQLLILEHPRH